jgi:thiamine biosynthesis lipoprotein
MGGLCEVLVETSSTPKSLQVFEVVYNEAKRLETKYSRYRDDNIVNKINNSSGKPVDIDDETFSLLQFADSLYDASNGLFDITSGVLRKIWTFDGKSLVPEKKQIDRMLKYTGWKKVKYDQSSISLPENWELDFGGLGKEYAVDSCCNKARMLNIAPALINLGGDIAVTGPKKNNAKWTIQVDQSDKVILLSNGGVATSGDKNKYLMHNGKKLSHILNPKTGWPIANAPRSVTVIAPNCTEAGAISTLSSLMGTNCEKFLKSEAQEYYVIR